MKHRIFPLLAPLLLALTALIPSAAPLHAQSPAASYYASGIQAYQQGDLETAQKQLQLALDVDPTFQLARTALARINIQLKQRGSALPSATQTKILEKLIIPVEFNNTTLSQALDFLRQKASDQTAGKVQPNFVLKLPPELAAKRITLQLNNVPFTEVLRYIGQLAGVEFKPDQYAILVTPVAR